MPSIASDFTKLAAAGADATAIAVVVGCSTGCGAILLGATMLGFAVASILEEISDSAAAKALVALSMWEDAQVEGASRPLATRSVAASTDGHGGGTPPLPAQASFSIKKQLLTRFESGEGDQYERSALAQGLAPLALRDAGVRSVLIARLKADTHLHDMSITTATWRVLRVDRLSQP